MRGILLCIVVAILFGSTGTVLAQIEQVVRVRLFDQAAPVKVRVAGQAGPVRLYAGDFADEIVRLEAGQNAVVSHASNQLHIQIGESGIFANTIRIEADHGAQIQLSVEDGRSTTKPRSYEGRIRIAPDDAGSDLKVVNQIDLEDYVAAVISTEYGFDDLEGAKAMAVIIRTYTLAVINKYDTEYDHVDHTLSQVYRGTDRITPTMREAVRQTKGEVLRHNGQLIEAVYFSASGGHTADNESVWRSKALPYLRGKPDPYGASAPDAEWRVRISRSRLLSVLSDVYGDVTGFVLGDRGTDGRVTSVDLLKTSGDRRTIPANEFRILVLKHFGDRTLRSTMFTARRDADDYVFEGKGNGHGVGLSQWGAREMAQRKMSYLDILDFYYTDVRLESRDELRSPQEQPRAEVESKEEPRRTSGRIGW